MISRTSLSAVLGFAALALGACQDNPTAPTRAHTADVAAAPSLETPAGARLTLATSSVTVAVLNPTVDNVYVSAEGHRLVIPAYSICNILTSGYGPSTWNSPCSPQLLPITFTITSKVDADGRPRVDVFPDVRMSPSKIVYAQFRDAAAANAAVPLIKYCPTLGADCIDESLTDASLKTYTSPTTGYVYRRIKHFSGYNVTFGYTCEAGAFDCPTGETGGY